MSVNGHREFCVSVIVSSQSRESRTDYERCVEEWGSCYLGVKMGGKETRFHGQMKDENSGCE